MSYLAFASLVQIDTRYSNVVPTMGEGVFAMDNEIEAFRKNVKKGRLKGMFIDTSLPEPYDGPVRFGWFRGSWGLLLPWRVETWIVLLFVLVAVIIYAVIEFM